VEAFVEAVSGVREFARKRTPDLPPTVGTVVEALQVAPCAKRFAYGELDPSGELATARFAAAGPDAGPASLARVLGGKLAEHVDEKRRGALLAVHRSLAFGWLVCAQTLANASALRNEPIKIRSERDAEDIWDFWAPSAHQRLETTGVQHDLADSVRGGAAGLLVADLKRLRLTRLFGGVRLNQLGMRYGQAGWLLRVTQTSEIGAERFQLALALVGANPDRPWRFERYPV
jgi:hypothetical protein